VEPRDAENTLDARSLDGSRGVHLTDRHVARHHVAIGDQQRRLDAVDSQWRQLISWLTGDNWLGF
jgi:hypothetical protein